MSARDVRSVGDLSPFSLTVNFGESVNLAGTTKKFYLKTLDLGTTKVNGVAATATNVTEEEGGASAPALSIWRLEYAPTLQNVDTKGDYLGRFEITYAGSDVRYYPPNGEFILCEMRAG